jgi:surface antigen
LLVREYKGKEADRLVARIDSGVVSLVAELRGNARQTAEELERKALDASPAARALELEKRALESAA